MNEINIDEMTNAEIMEKRDELLAQVERLQAEKAQEREERAIKFTREFFEEHAPAENKKLLLAVSDDFARKFIEMVLKLH